MTIQGKQVNFEVEQVNTVYGLLNANMGKFHAKACKSGTWMANILCPRKVVPSKTTKRDILINDVKVKARLWLNIICSRVSPCTYMAIITNIRARMGACLLIGIALNIGEIVILELLYFKNHGARLDTEDEAPVYWSADDAASGDVESSGEDSS
ncbi:hypothetical protein FXO37_25462 [Capsicum annuum]|nr:hypothetical protein FXO37_25462 [Capsicum annuum]